MTRFHSPRLVSTHPVTYSDNERTIRYRPCRIWHLDLSTCLAIVTETREPSMSIETAAHQIRTQLEAHCWLIYETPIVRIVEHWPTGTGAAIDEDHYAEQYQRTSRMYWRPITDFELDYLTQGLHSIGIPDATPIAPTPPAERTAHH